MTETELALAVYAAVLSTMLAALTVVNFIRDRPRIAIEAHPVHLAAASVREDALGTPVQVRRGQDLLWEEVEIEVTVRNRGRQAVQIDAVHIQYGKQEFHARAEGLPTLLQPNTSCADRVQPELVAEGRLDPQGGVAYTAPRAIGVIDARGRRHVLSSVDVQRLFDVAALLPLRIGVYRHRESGERVVARQSRHDVAIVTLSTGSAHRASRRAV